jgi:hypothetical protein
MLVVKFPHMTEPGNNVCVSNHPTIMAIVPNGSEPNILSPNGNAGVYNSGYKGYFDSPEEILNDINMESAFHISEECKKSVDGLSRTDGTFETAYKIMQFLDIDKTIVESEEDETYYMLINTYKSDFGGAWSQYNSVRFPTFVYAIDSTYNAIKKKITMMHYDNIVAYLKDSGKRYSVGVVPTINHPPFTGITIDDVNDAALDKNNVRETFDIYKFMSKIMLKITTDVRPYGYSEIIKDMYGISNLMTILKINKKTAALARYRHAFIFTPLDDMGAYIPNDISDAFIITSGVSRYSPMNPIINKTLYPSYQNDTPAPPFIHPINDNNMSESYMVPKPLSEEYPHLFKEYGGNKMHILQNSPTIPVENDPEESVDDDYSTNIEDNDMGD